MSSFKPLHALKSIASWIPDIERPLPGKKVPLKDKFLYTAVALFVFLVCSQLPLYGIKTNTGSDPFYWARMIMASSKGTLMELGIGPIVTSGMVMQLLVGTQLISIDTNVKEDKALYNGVQKLLALLITAGEAIAYVFSGMYGNVSTELGPLNTTLIILQLIAAGIVVMLLDDLLQSPEPGRVDGYGLGSGISLFIATNTCEMVAWQAFSPLTVARETGTQFEGAVVSLVSSLFSERDKVRAIKNAFYRTNSPNLSSLLATAVIFMLVIFLQGFRVELPITSRKSAAYKSTIPIKLFYTSNMPIILQSALVSNLFFLSQLLWRRFAQDGKGLVARLVMLLGHWQYIQTGQLKPVNGLIYYLSPPSSVTEAFTDPLHFVLYVAFMLTSCALFSKVWIEISMQSAKHIASSLRQQNMKLAFARDDPKAMQEQLNRYIPTAAAFGGMCIGLLTIAADLLGAVGSGTGILLAVTIVYQFFEAIDKERKEAMGETIIG